MFRLQQSAQQQVSDEKEKTERTRADKAVVEAESEEHARQLRAKDEEIARLLSSLSSTEVGGGGRKEKKGKVSRRRRRRRSSNSNSRSRSSSTGSISSDSQDEADDDEEEEEHVGVVEVEDRNRSTCTCVGHSFVPLACLRVLLVNRMPGVAWREEPGICWDRKRISTDVVIFSNYAPFLLHVYIVHYPMWLTAGFSHPGENRRGNF